MYIERLILLKVTFIYTVYIYFAHKFLQKQITTTTDLYSYETTKNYKGLECPF